MNGAMNEDMNEEMNEETNETWNTIDLYCDETCDFNFTDDENAENLHQLRRCSNTSSSSTSSTISSSPRVDEQQRRTTTRRETTIFPKYGSTRRKSSICRWYLPVVLAGGTSKIICPFRSYRRNGCECRNLPSYEERREEEEKIARSKITTRSRMMVVSLYYRSRRSV